MSKLFVRFREWAGVVALILVLTGGIAYAANTVRSSDIVDGEVKIADIGQGAVATSEVLNDTATGGGLAAADLRSGSVGTAEVANNSLRGDDLGVRVRSDQQVDDGSAAATCGTTADFEECITVFFNVPRPQRLLLIGSADWGGHRAPDTNRGECRFSVPGFPDLGLRKFGQHSETGADLQHRYTVALNAVTPVLDAL